ncbi:C-type mannose receptor 2-like isoform X1 [Hemibagrus wyckioides]|uniref:C-type mannose receptor 2-like isoform X1 n=1 Tax=Hemibagrus wyckioides TaxID=337641 RepID=UPI00266BD95B|nr:C-type mannose receptor 2-like isoform X1 [Hemibagrus wyckioides]
MKAYLFLLTFIGIVPATLSLLRPVGHKYYVIKTKVTWPVAQNYCRETYADMATVESALDWLRLREEVAREGLTDIAWVGLYNDIDTWRWSINNVPLKHGYVLWGSAQPDNTGGHQACGVTGPLGYWWDYSCGNLYPFICYNAINSYAARYVGVTSKLDWNGALAYCRKFHTDLAFALTMTDNNAMQSIAFNQGMSWIGAFRDTWKWSDGENTSNILWFSGQPDNYYGNENCAVLDKGMYQDTLCTGLNYFICHITHPVRERQILRLQVKSDLSIFDSDVQSAILELVKQKLTENGMMENTTVTWRVKSNGEIFHKKKTDL